MKTPICYTENSLLSVGFAAGLLLGVASSVHGDIVGPHTPDADTLYLFHFDEGAGGSVTTNVGSKGGVSYSVDMSTATTIPPLVTGLLGSAGYSSGATSFGNCVASTTTGYLLGYDFDKSGAFEASTYGTPITPDAVVHTNLNIGNGSQTPFTIEVLVAPSAIVSSVDQEIVCTDNARGNADRGFQFRITKAGQLQFQYIGGGSPISYAVNIPTSGPHGFVANAWFHVAVTYDGATVRLYWTRLDPTITAANQIGTGSAMSLDAARGAVAGPLVFGNDGRDVASELFTGKIDEIRISSVTRGAGEMQFDSPTVTISEDPASQNIDNQQPVTFSVTASSKTELGYQWRFNSTPILDATNTSYSIPSVASLDAGDYDVVVTNISGNASTSEVAVLTVGAANFLAHRWSFTSDTSDSIGGATGTNQGNATVSAGALVLDGTTNTFMELPGRLLEGLSAVTFDFWATFGINGDNCRVFDFGNTNGVINNLPGVPLNYVFFSPRTGGGTHALTLSPGENIFEQSVAGQGTLDEQTLHVTCVVDPPNQFLGIYTNGVLEVANPNVTVPLATLNDLLCWVGRSLYPADAYLNGSIDELRLYSGALSASSVQQSELQGPDDLLYDGPVQFVAEPADTVTADGQMAAFSGLTIGHPPITYQWYEEGSPIVGATNPIYSFVAVAGQDGHEFQLMVTNNILGTNYTASSSNATLTLTIPESKTWLGVNGANWDISTLNWSNATSLAPFNQFDAAVFDARGNAQPNVDLTQATHVTGLTVNSSTDYLLTSSGKNGSLDGTTTLVKQGSGKLTLDVPTDVSLGTLIQGGTLQIGNGGDSGSLGAGPVTNNATLTFNRTNALSVPNVISGTGQVTKMGAGSAALSGSNSYSGVTLISQGTVNVRNATALGAATAGTTVSVGGQLYVDANVDVLGEALSLGGIAPSAMRKGGGGTSVLSGTLTLTADTDIHVDGGATLNLTSPTGISGSSVNLSLAGDGTTALGFVTGPISLGSGALTNAGGAWRLLNLNNSYSGKTFITGGRLEVGAPAALGATPGVFTADQITLNGGSLGAFTNYALSDGRRGITVGPDVGGGFYCADGATLTIANEISGGLPLTKSGPGTLILAGPNNNFYGDLNVDTASTANSDGIVRIADPGAILGVFTISILNNNGGSSTLQLDGSSAGVELPYGQVISWAGRNNEVPAIENFAGTNTISASISMTTGGSQYRIQSSSGLLTIGGFIGTTATSARTVTFQGSADINVSNTGGIIDGSEVGAAVSVVKDGNGTLTYDSGGLSYTGPTTISNGLLNVMSDFYGAGAMVVAGGALGGTATLYPSSVTVQAGGALAPGASVGTLTLNCDLTNSGNLWIEVDKSLSPAQSNDVVVVTGSLVNSGNGTVMVNDLGPTLAVGDRFVLFNGRALANGNLMGVSGGGAIWKNDLAVDGSITVLSTTIPQPTLNQPVLVSGTNLVLSGTGGPANSPFSVRSSTNAAMPVTSWTVVGTGAFTGSGAFSFTNAISSGEPQRFYIISIP